MSNPKYAANYRYKKTAKGLATQARYRKTEKGARAVRKYHLKRTYGLAIDDWDKMLAAQGFRCLACGTLESGGRNGIGWHTHHTGSKKEGTIKIHGILCRGCNMLLEKGVTSSYLRSMADFLDKCDV